ncbi:MAG TPA: iron-sulfur cluster assembly scaffold protein [Candidatus Acidoferrales bacterium]
MFNEIVLEHFRNPHNAGELANATATVEVTNPVCGDILRLSVRVEGNSIVEIRFKTQGCVAAIAASSILTDLLAGKSRVQAGEITAELISRSLNNLPPASFHAAQLCVDGVAALLRQFPSEQV